MSNEDDQAEELEVLASIFPVEFQLIEGKDKCFTITLAPHPPGGEENHGKIDSIEKIPYTQVASLSLATHLRHSKIHYRYPCNSNQFDAFNFICSLI